LTPDSFAHSLIQSFIAMNIYILAFLLLFQFLSCNQASAFPRASHLPDNHQKQKTGMAGTAPIVFKSSDGGQTSQDIREGLSDKLEKGGFSLYRKPGICKVFYRQARGQTQSIYAAPTLKGYEK
jgi:hypothetical protein